MTYTTKEKTAAIMLVETARRCELSLEGQYRALRLAANYALDGTDLTVLKVLTYPAPKEDVKC
jgi:hypothetical protein